MEIQEIKECFSDEINLISDKLCNVKSQDNILKWLQNFNSDDWIYALELLQNIYYVGESDLYVECDNMINKLQKEIGDNSHIYFSPIAKYGKSATLLTYYMERSPKFQKLINSGNATYLVNRYDIVTTYYTSNCSIVFFDIGYVPKKFSG